MLYLDYSRQEGEWIPNVHGGNENLEAICFIQALNIDIYGAHPGRRHRRRGVDGVARGFAAGRCRRSRVWLQVGHGLDARHPRLLPSASPVHRAYHQDDLTFRGLYQYDENFMLSLSHDEVVHGKGSLVNKMPGDEWQQFANLRALYGYMYSLPGKKLLFMGGEFGQRSEWSVDHGLDWWVLEYPNHAGTQQWTKALNEAYRGVPALHELDHEQGGFEWIDASDAAAQRVELPPQRPQRRKCSLRRELHTGASQSYRIGVPSGGEWEVLLNSDWPGFWGTGAGPQGTAMADEIPMHGRPFSIEIDLPPLGCVFLKPRSGPPTRYWRLAGRRREAVRAAEASRHHSAHTESAGGGAWAAGGEPLSLDSARASRALPHTNGASSGV